MPSVPRTHAGVTELSRGHGFLEGPRWHDGRLYASEVRGGRVIAIDDRGNIETIHYIDGFPSGLGFDRDGRLLIVSMKTRKLLRSELDGSLSELASVASISPGSLNDMLIDSHGRAYISTLAADPTVTPLKELDEPSWIVCVEPDGTARKEGGGLRFGNGIALTPDGSTLLVAETFAGRISAFDVGTNGALSARRDWYVFDPRPAAASLGGFWSTKPAPDGIAIDREGGLWVADAGGHGAYRVTERDGVTDFVDTGELAVFAVALGGFDGRTLFMCMGSPLGNGPRDAAVQHRVLTCKVAVGG
jgi:sugar lactone lactonase YvrE